MSYVRSIYVLCLRDNSSNSVAKHITFTVLFSVTMLVKINISKELAIFVVKGCQYNSIVKGLHLYK